MKGLGIYDKDYHKEYHQYVKEKRYKQYLDSLRLEWFTQFIEIRRKLQTEKLLQERFPKPSFQIEKDW